MGFLECLCKDECVFFRILLKLFKNIYPILFQDLFLLPLIVRLPGIPKLGSINFSEEEKIYFFQKKSILTRTVKYRMTKKNLLLHLRTQRVAIGRKNMRELIILVSIFVCRI